MTSADHMVRIGPVNRPTGRVFPDPGTETGRSRALELTAWARRASASRRSDSSWEDTVNQP